MKKTAFLMLLIAFGSICYASQDTTDNQEYFRKKQELDLLAERFKVETGFEGAIEYDYSTMKLSSYRGLFSDVHFSNLQDTTSLRISFDIVLDKIAPYISAPKNQLYKTEVFLNMWGNGTRYIQMVNGYPIESGGYLNVTYSPNSGRVDILDVTIDIPQEPLGSIIPKEEAFSIARRAYEQTEYCNENTPIHRSRTTILYRTRIVRGIEQPYRLCWKVAFPGLLYYIDAVTSEYYTEGYVVNDDNTVR